MSEKQFIEELKKISIEISEFQLKQLTTYYNLLIEWNEKINLTTIIKKEDVYLKHFYDSATINKIITLNKIENLCDIGSGAGFPGIVLKILFPEIHITMIDSLKKRIIFLTTVIKKLELKDIVALHSRAEEFALKEREKFDIVTARAVAPLNILSEYCLPLVKVDGYFIPMKSDISQEIKGLNNVLKKLNSEKKQILEFYLPIKQSKRTLLKIQKIASNSLKYPRKFNEIKKTPL